MTVPAHRLLLLCAALGSSLLLPALSAPGDRDSEFGEGGTVITPIGPEHDFPWGVAVLKDGRTVVGGQYFGGSGGGDFAVVRYRKDGTLDPSFDGDGIATTDFAGGFDSAYALAAQKDGKVILAGDADDDFALARYRSDGSLDPKFGEGGKLLTDFGGSDGAVGVYVLGNRRILVAGSTSGKQSAFAAARYLPNGDLDQSFGEGGKVTVDMAGGSFIVTNDSALQKNGAVLIGGRVGTSPSDLAIVRITKKGVPDPTFGEKGRVRVNLGSNSEEIEGIAVQADGKIVVSGETQIAGVATGFVLRLLKNGDTDLGFGEGGVRLLDQSTGDVYAGSIRVGAKGVIYVGGSVVDQDDHDVNAVWALDKNGDFVPGFGEGGLVTTPIQGFARILGMTLTKTALVAVGFTNDGGPADFTTTRYLLK